MSGPRTTSFSAPLLASLCVHGLVGVGMWFAPAVDAESAPEPSWRKGHLVMLEQPPMVATPPPPPTNADPPTPPESPQPVPVPVSAPAPAEPEQTPPPVRVGDVEGSRDARNPISSKAEGEHLARQGDQDQPGMSIHAGPGGPPAPAIAGSAAPSAPQPPSPAVERVRQPPDAPSTEPEPAKPAAQQPVEHTTREADQTRPSSADLASQPDAKPGPPVGASTSPLEPSTKPDPRPTTDAPTDRPVDPDKPVETVKPVVPSETPRPADEPPVPAPDKPRDPPMVVDPPRAPQPDPLVRPAEPIDTTRPIADRDRTAASPPKVNDGAGLAAREVTPNVPEADEARDASRTPAPAPIEPPPPPPEPARTPAVQDALTREGALKDTLQPLTLDQRAVDAILAMSVPQLSPIAPLLLDRASRTATRQPPAPKPEPVTAVVAPSQPGSRPGGGDPGEQGPKDSDAFSRKVTGEYRNGRVVGAEGLDIRTVRPQFTLLARTFTSPRSVVVDVAFLRTGQVKEARIARSSGFDAEIDQPVLNAVYAWTARGKLLDELPDHPDAHVMLTVAINLR